MEPDETRIPGALRRAVERDGPRLLRPDTAPGQVLGPWMRETERRELLLAPLCGEQALLGAIALANREGRVTEFTSADLTLLETLANHTAVSLEHDQLEQALVGADRGPRPARAPRPPRPADRPRQPRAVHPAGRGRAQPPRRPRGRAAPRPRRLQARQRPLRPRDRRRAARRLHPPPALLPARPSDLPARLGGDEFAVLLDRGDHERATRIAERIQLAFKEPFKLSTATLRIGASTGIALGEHGEASAAEVLRNADVAMYAAKEQEKGHFEVFDDRQAAPLLRRDTLTGELERAVEQRSLEVSYQPIVELATGRVVGAEALARWHRDGAEDISPSEFIPLAERSGLIVPIGELVQARAFTQLQRWERSAQVGGLLMHVNLSPAELRDPELVARVAAGIDDAGLDPSRLVLEVTESTLLEDARLTVAQLERLRALGVRIAIDDFGTGYSSLQTLQTLPIDMLKMAPRFVEDDEGLAFQTTILQLARALGVQVVAEGIENEAQLERLRELGCDMGQGFHLSPPGQRRRATRPAAAPGRPPERGRARPHGRVS